MRLNAYLASCGAASRRKSEIMILEGRVQVNGKIVLAPYFDVSPENDEIKLNGKILKAQEHVYYVMNKPKGYVCAVSDKYDPVVLELLPENLRKNTRLYPVGRLDRESEGLLILTNDGTFTQSITHPSNEISKSYEAMLNHEINPRQIESWSKGFELEIIDPEKNLDMRKFVKPLSIAIMNREPENKWIEIAICDGVKREVRLMARHMGFRVERLIRRKIGNLQLENLRTGEYVSLSFSQLYSKILSGGMV